MPCSATIKSTSDVLRSLDSALIKSGLYPALDTAPNVTCLAPSTRAFGNAGNPEIQLNSTDLGGALL
jgi:hypothetical protein